MGRSGGVILAVTRANQRVDCLVADGCDLIIGAQVTPHGFEQSMELTIYGIIGEPEVPGHATHAALYLNDFIEGPMICRFLDCDFHWGEDSQGGPVLKGSGSIFQILGPGVEFDLEDED